MEWEVLEEIADARPRHPRRDRALTGCWKLLTNHGSEPPKRSRELKRREAEAIISGDLMTAHLNNRWVSYSRRPEWYSARSRSRYHPPALTFQNLVRFVASAEASQMIEHQKSKPGWLGVQSRMRLTETGVLAIEQAGARLAYAPPEIIVLRSGIGKLAEYADNAETHRMRANLLEINDATAGTNLAYQGRLVRSGDQIIVDGQRRIVHHEMYRIFNRENFEYGGRFYGSWWQNIPRAERRQILINGSPVIECDYRQLHPTLLYAMVGKEIDGDAYVIAGWDRSLVKTALNTLINAENQLAALRSIARQIGGGGAFERASNLIRSIEGKHPAISEYFGSGAGLKMQRIDSDMAEQVLLRLTRSGIASLPVHDSFIVEKRHDGVLQEVMSSVFDQKLRSLGGNGLKTICLSENVPQYGIGVSLVERSSSLGSDCSNDNLPRTAAISRCPPPEGEHSGSGSLAA